MEYIKKEELIEGEIYYVSTTYGFWMIGLVTKSNNGDNDYSSFRGNATYISKDEDFNKDRSWCYEANGRTYRLASSEEKHWLTSCITADKFITFEEAMKTFIPEYYQYIGEIDSYKSSFIKGKTYKIINKNDLEASFNFIDEKGTPNGYEGVNWKKFKPSTKEAYDAQFVVKEPEVVLPEKWCILRTGNNYNIINKWFQDNNLGKPYTKYGYIWKSNNNYATYLTKPERCTEITFEQFKKYVLKEEIVEEKVIEPLPQFKIIESIETITKVENNEGNQFFIGDEVIGSKTKIKYKIISFKYNVDKTAILAITDKTPNIGIGINHLEHYIEPKVEETLLEKAKRLYPIGTKFKSVISKRIFTIKNHIQEPCQNPNTIVFGTNEINADNKFCACVHSYICEWAEIIE